MHIILSATHPKAITRDDDNHNNVNHSLFVDARCREHVCWMLRRLINKSEDECALGLLSRQFSDKLLIKCMYWENCLHIGRMCEYCVHIGCLLVKTVMGLKSKA